MNPRRKKLKLVTEYGISSYQCGLKAGDRVELRKPLEICDLGGKPTGIVHPAGEVWTVLSGSKDDPGVVWFLRPDGERHTWNDAAAQIDEWFKKIGPTD